MQQILNMLQQMQPSNNNTDEITEEVSSKS